MDRLKQDLIVSPSIPQDIRYRRYSRQSANDAAHLISGLSSRVLGVDIQLSSRGSLEAVAFSTYEEVYIVSVEGDTYKRRQSEDFKAFKALLRGSCLLIGFEMDKIALQLASSFCFHVPGIDLSTLLSRKTKIPWLPSKLVEKMISNAKTKGSQIDDLWVSSGDWRDLCIRAWIAAR
jgi:hypothetical protein